MLQMEAILDYDVLYKAACFTRRHTRQTNEAANDDTDVDLDIVHYEYMALAKKTSVLREAVLLFVEPRRCGASEYADIF